VVSAHVCPEHPEHAVTWRGRGCPVCSADRIYREVLARKGRARRGRFDTAGQDVGFSGRTEELFDVGGRR
jgi:hypothetical protein